MSEPNPSDDAERIRLKRLAKLGGPAASSSSPRTPPTPSNSTQSAKVPASQRVPAGSVHQSTSAPAKPAALRKPQEKPVVLDRALWTESTMEHIFLITLQKGRAEASGWKMVWLKSLSEEIQAERESLVLQLDDLDQVLMARLDVNSESNVEDPEYAVVVASLPHEETLFEYLVGCWNRNNAARAAFSRQPRTPEDYQHASGVFSKIKHLVISYIGLAIQDPSMFPQTSSKPLGAIELLPVLLSLTNLASPLSSSTLGGGVLRPEDLDTFISDLVERFPSQEEQLDDVLGPVIRLLLFHPSLAKPEGIAGGDSGWRTIAAALNALVHHPAIAKMVARLEEWCPRDAAANEIERVSLLGPLARLGVFYREWPQIGTTYFSDYQNRSRADFDSSNNSLRSTLNALQGALFQAVNSLVRAGPEPREQVLQYFARVISINTKRAGSHVDYRTVATDGFMINLQAVLLRLAEPFMDAQFTKLDRIDGDFLGRSQRMDLSDETRVNATSEEVTNYSETLRSSSGTPPNFITEVFYLTMAVNHYALMRAFQFEEQVQKVIQNRQTMLEAFDADNSWQGTPRQAQFEAQIARIKADIERLHVEIFAYQTQLLDPTLLAKQAGFAGFVSAWLIRMVDPRKQHPTVMIELPLPKEQPVSYRMLPELVLDDVADFYLYLLRHRSNILDVSSQVELVTFVMTFLSSPWYIKNPFLKAKLVTVLFFGTLGTEGDKHGVLFGQLNSHKLCLKHLMAALVSFYIEIETSGSHSQFYDKFTSRREIAAVLNAIWHTPGHREALKVVASDLKLFTRFVNLMINDVTFLLDESFSRLAEVARIQKEMDQPDWSATPAQQRSERMNHLHSVTGQAKSYLSLAKSTMKLLIKFTKETVKPFMTPEIVNRLAAMLDYNLTTLVGPKCTELKVKDKDKLKFDPRELLSDLLQIYLNLCAEDDFIAAIAKDERSFDPATFQRATKIARERSLKPEADIEKITQLTLNASATKERLDLEEDTADLPDEFLDPIVFTIMKDPVTLPTSGQVVDLATIKSHLLSDSKDPFNRMPLSIDDVIPNSELKFRITEFLDSRRKRRLALEESKMDVDS